MWLVWGSGEQFLPRLPVDSIDTTGAGDAFTAAMAVMIAEGKALEEAAPFANAAAALTTTVFGAQAALPSREAVEDISGSPGNKRGHPVLKRRQPIEEGEHMDSVRR